MALVFGLLLVISYHSSLFAEIDILYQHCSDGCCTIFHSALKKSAVAHCRFACRGHCHQLCTVVALSFTGYVPACWFSVFFKWTTCRQNEDTKSFLSHQRRAGFFFLFPRSQQQQHQHHQQRFCDLYRPSSLHNPTLLTTLHSRIKSD